MKTVYAACGASLAIGLFFIFVWAPQPWGWEGFDHYHQLALAVARGEPFPTLDVPWGYAYFLAFFYRIFGDRPWVPLVVQAGLNAVVPLLVFRFARRWLDRRTAAVASLLTGLFSFNTVYASTQSSDAVCTVLFMAMAVAFARALGGASWRPFGAAGVLGGLAPQFRPNLILIPVLIAVYAVWTRRSRQAVAHAGLLVACAALVLSPWIVRNYRLTGMVLPTSVHGGVQLWYGTLQVGPYLYSRAYNPRSVFEAPAFHYTSLSDVPLIVTASARPCDPAMPHVTLTAWTDRDPGRRTFVPNAADGRTVNFEVPATRGPAVVYYYLTAAWPRRNGLATTPRFGDSAPFVYFVSQDHLGDLDVHDDLLDIFDVIDVTRHAAWGERVRAAAAFEAAGLDPGDLRETVRQLTARFVAGSRVRDGDLVSLTSTPDRATVVLGDGSSIGIPRRYDRRITDLAFAGPVAEHLMHASVSFASLRALHGTAAPGFAETCAELEDVSVNGVFYRREPYLMQRYSALAWDNIRHDPVAFVIASAYRAIRLFVIQGSEDSHTAQQFSRSRLIYAAATAVSAVYLLVAVAGTVIAWRRRYAVLLPLLLVLYVPVTICAVLTNMRYTVTVQPIVFMFVAVAVTAALDRITGRTAPREAVEAPDC